MLKKRLSALDAFPKIQDSNITDSSQTGGIVSVFVLTFLAFLAISEITTFMGVHQDYEFLVDQSRSLTANLQVNMDVTVNTPCSCEFLPCYPCYGKGLPRMYSRA